MVRRLPNLNQLRAFEAAARHLSFSRAADELHVSPTAISHRIRELEADLGVQLFRRRVRAISLTDKASELATELKDAFDRIGAAVDSFAVDGLEGEIRISVAPFFGNRVFLPFLPRFHADFPNLKILPSMSTEVVDLTASELDGALRYGDGKWDGMSAIKLFTDSVLPVAATGLVSERSVPMSPEDIADFTLAAGADGDQDWKDWFAAMGLSDKHRLNTITYSTRAGSTDMALSGLGAALCEQLLVREDVALGRLVVLHPQSIPARKSMYLVFPETDRPDPRLLALANWLQTAISDAL